MVRFLRAALVLSLTLVARDVSANWFRSQPPVVSSYYYYPTPVICVPNYQVVAPIYSAQPPPIGVLAPQSQQPQQPQGQQPGYAKPSPAPASSGTPPAVDETRKSNYYDAYAVERRLAGMTDRCTVGFWNQSGQDVTVTVAGQPRLLQRGQGVTLELPRRFAWQIEGREVVQESIGDTQSGVEIVIRR